MKFLLKRKSWNGNLWALLCLQLSSAPASLSDPTWQEDCAVPVLLLSLGSGYSSHLTHSSLPPYGRPCCLLSLGLHLGVCFPGLGDAQYKAKSSWVCVACWGRRIRKKPEVILPAPCVELHTKFQGFIDSLDVSIFVLIYSWLIRGDLVAALLSLRCLFLFKECLWTARLWRSRSQGSQGSTLMPGCTAWPVLYGARDRVISGKQHRVLQLTMPLQSPGELSLLLALPHTEFQAVGRQQLLVGTGEVEGDGCEVNCQTHLPCTGGTTGLSLEQSSPSQAPPTSSSNRSAPHPLWVGNCDRSGSRSLADTRGAAFRQPALPSLLSRLPSLWLVSELSSFPPALPLFAAFW